MGAFTPPRMPTSDGLIPEARTRISTSPRPGSGFGRSPICKTSRAGPVRSYQAARIVGSQVEGVGLEVPAVGRQMFDAAHLVDGRLHVRPLANGRQAAVLLRHPLGIVGGDGRVLEF